MSADEFLKLQLREQFAINSRLSAELDAIRNRLVLAEIKILRLEDSLGDESSSSATTFHAWRGETPRVAAKKNELSVTS